MPYQVVVTLSCTDIVIFEERNVALLPQKGQTKTCNVCHQEVKVLMVGKPYQVKEKEPTSK